jgi:hypothetical protein
MTRKSRIPAAEAATAAPHRSLDGRKVILLRRFNTKGKPVLPKSHPRCPAPGWLPYKSPGSARASCPLKRVSLRGWLPPDYPLLPL